jgi:hypothetical protein
MDRIYELVWEKPPEPYGIFVNCRNWQIRTFINTEYENKRVKKSVVVWTHDVDTKVDVFYVAAVIYRFGAYLLESFKLLKPDTQRLAKLLREQLEIAHKKNLLKTEDYENVLAECERVLESLGRATDESRNNESEYEDPSTGSQSDSTQVTPVTQKLFTKLTVDGYSDFKLLFQVLN